MSLTSVPNHRILHISDMQLLTGDEIADGRTGVGDAVTNLLCEVEGITARPEAMALTGTLPDRYRDSYPWFRSAVERASERLDVQVIWALGDHSGEASRRMSPEADSPREVRDLNGLRVITVDSNVPGRLHGEVDDDQLFWLRSVLATPAPHGSILVLHHPPVPNPDPLMEMGELTDQAGLESVVTGTDVRGILAGHLHYQTLCSFAEVSVSVAASACYTQDLGIDWGGAGGQAHLVHAFGDRIMHTAVRLGRRTR
jgi:Icc protein